MILCCYPGTGKTFACRARKDTLEYRYDMPRKELCKAYLSDEETAELDAYCDARALEIKEMSEKCRFLIMQPDFRLFYAMERNNIPYTIVIPDYREPGTKEDMLKRYKARGTVSKNFIENFIGMWDIRMAMFERKTAPKIYLKRGQYISDILNQLSDCPKDVPPSEKVKED